MKEFRREIAFPRLNNFQYNMRSNVFSPLKIFVEVRPFKMSENQNERAEMDLGLNHYVREKRLITYAICMLIQKICDPPRG